MVGSECELESLIDSIAFAAEKHSKQRRKDSEATPYINYPIAVAETLANVGRVSDVATLQAAVLHDTLEDTDATAEQISQLFGDQVLSIVLEVTDDKSLPKPERRKAQVERARRMSNSAKQIKVADKISNIGDIDIDGPMGWSTKEKMEYLTFSEQVVLSCNGCNHNLESRFASILDEKRRLFAES